MCEPGIGLSRRRVVQAVVMPGKIRGTDRQPGEVEADAVALATEQLAQQRIALRRRHAVLDQPGGRIGDRCAEAQHALVAPVRIDLDVDCTRIFLSEARLGCGGQGLRMVGGGDPDPGTPRVLRSTSRRLLGQTCAGSERQSHRQHRQPMQADPRRKPEESHPVRIGLHRCLLARLWNATLAQQHCCDATSKAAGMINSRKTSCVQAVMRTQRRVLLDKQISRTY